MNLQDAIKIVEEHIDDRLNNQGQYHNVDLTTALCKLTDFASFGMDVMPEDAMESFEKPPEIKVNFLKDALWSDKCPFCGESRTIVGEEFSNEIAHQCPSCGSTWVVVHAPTVIKVGKDVYKEPR